MRGKGPNLFETDRSALCVDIKASNFQTDFPLLLIIQLVYKSKAEVSQTGGKPRQVGEDPDPTRDEIRWVARWIKTYYYAHCLILSLSL